MISRDKWKLLHRMGHSTSYITRGGQVAALSISPKCTCYKGIFCTWLSIISNLVNPQTWIFPNILPNTNMWYKHHVTVWIFSLWLLSILNFDPAISCSFWALLPISYRTSIGIVIFLLYLFLFHIMVCFTLNFFNAMYNMRSCTKTTFCHGFTIRP